MHKITELLWHDKWKQRLGEGFVAPGEWGKACQSLDLNIEELWTSVAYADTKRKKLSILANAYAEAGKKYDLAITGKPDWSKLPTTMFCCVSAYYATQLTIEGIPTYDDTMKSTIAPELILRLFDAEYQLNAQ